MEESNQDRNQSINDFTKGIDLIFKSLFEAAQKASFRIGLGTLTLGLAYIYLGEYSELIRLLIGMGLFFISAKIGGLADKYIDVKFQKYLTIVHKNDLNNEYLKRIELNKEEPKDKLDLDQTIGSKQEVKIEKEVK